MFCTWWNFHRPWLCRLSMKGEAGSEARVVAMNFLVLSASNECLRLKTATFQGVACSSLVFHSPFELMFVVFGR